MRLFVALCRRYGLERYRYARQHHSTRRVRAPEPFQNNTLWPQFRALDEALSRQLAAVTERVIRAAVHDDPSDACVVREPAPLGGR